MRNSNIPCWKDAWKAAILNTVIYFDTNEFKTTFSKLNRFLKKYKRKIQMLLLYLIKHININMQTEGKPLFELKQDLIKRICDIENDDELKNLHILLEALNLLIKEKSGSLYYFNEYKVSRLAELNKLIENMEFIITHLLKDISKHVPDAYKIHLNNVNVFDSELI